MVRGRDHAITEVFIFGPFMYWKVVRSTFGDQQVCRSITMPPMQAEQFLLQQFKQGWLKRYSWGCSSMASSLPTAYILLKQKKELQVARPIISYKFYSSLPSSFGQQPSYWISFQEKRCHVALGYKHSQQR